MLIRPPFAVEKFYFPRFINEPLGLECLKAYLKDKHHVEILDCLVDAWHNYWKMAEYPEIIFQGMKQKEIIKKILHYKPDVIGINWFFSTQNASVELVVKAIREFDKEIPIIVGGPHPSTNYKQILQENPLIDMVVYGEGEITLEEILNRGCKNLENVNGLVYRLGKEIIVNPPRDLIDNLDSLPLPDRDIKKFGNYSKQNFYQMVYIKLKKVIPNIDQRMTLTTLISRLPLLPKLYYEIYNVRNRSKSLPAADVLTSRGCPNHCTFCGVHNLWGHRWRSRSAESVLAEIDVLVKKFGIKHINFQDDNFNVSKQRTIKICRGIVENNYNITLVAPAGAFVPTLDEEVLIWLKKAGLRELRMSIESGNQEILSKVIKKNIDLSKVKKVVDICKKLGIYTEAAFIFGIPGETIETMKESIEYATKTGFNRLIKFIFQPFPNTELYDLCLKNNYLTPDYDSKKIYITGNKCFVKTEKFSPEDVLQIVDRKKNSDAED